MNLKVKGFVVGTVGLATLAAFGCSNEHEVVTPSKGTVALTYQPHNEKGEKCKLLEMATTNIKQSDIYAVYGEVYYRDINSKEVTNIPLQLIFNDYGDDIVDSDAITTINSETTCENLQIDIILLSCIKHSARPTKASCPTVNVSASGFAGVSIVEDKSVRYQGN